MTIAESNISWFLNLKTVKARTLKKISLLLRNEQYADDKICQCSLDTFGKFCEYEFTTKHTFDETIQYQFYLKKKYRIGSQLWGNITCYTALTDCYFGLRCLTWQNICDRKYTCCFTHR